MPSRDPEQRRAVARRAAATYRDTHAEEVRARKALWYQLNKARRARQQKAYRDSLRAEQGQQVLRTLARGVTTGSDS